jgi:PIN domain nuclease of toxin-antitoxin system
VKYLVDTGVWLWALDSFELLRGDVRRLFEDGQDEIYLSPVTTWEISIKMQLGKLKFPGPPVTRVPEFMATQGLRTLPVTHAHAAKVYDLPRLHKDPFDRLLIAQALVEHMTVVSSDRMFKQYAVPLLWAGR